SFGVVLYEMVAGVKPFWGTMIVDWILHREPKSLAQHTPDIPAGLRQIIDKALRKDRDQRYQTAEELLGDLRGLKQTIETGAGWGRFKNTALASEPQVKTAEEPVALKIHEDDRQMAFRGARSPSAQIDAYTTGRPGDAGSPNLGYFVFKT